MNEPDGEAQPNPAEPDAEALLLANLRRRAACAEGPRLHLWSGGKKTYHVVSSLTI
jgi:hypothetical protein